MELTYRQLKYWGLIGVVKPTLEPHGQKKYQKFSNEDLHFLKKVKALTNEGYLLSRAAEKLRKLRKKENNVQFSVQAVS